MDRRVKAALMFGGSWVVIGATVAFAPPLVPNYSSGPRATGFSGNVPQSTSGAWGEWKSPTTCSRKNGEVASDEQINLWISEALKVMKNQGIPGSREGFWKHINDESGGNPYICNPDDTNADAGTPSKGLIQVIDPTFKENHCEGTSDDTYEPVANLCAGAKYAWKRYGSIDTAPTPY
jgi:transglycosylase-like protein with SLT domain